MDEKVKEAMRDVRDAFLSEGTTEYREDLFRLSLEKLWIAAQIDFLENNPIKVLNITLDD